MQPSSEFPQPVHRTIKRSRREPVPAEKLQDHPQMGLLNSLSTNNTNNYRKSINLPTLNDVFIRAFDADQMVKNAVRLYNGPGSLRDQFGLPLEEFQISTKTVSGFGTIFVIDESTVDSNRNGWATCEEISGDARIAIYLNTFGSTKYQGDAYYVLHVTNNLPPP